MPELAKILVVVNFDKHLPYTIIITPSFFLSSDTPKPHKRTTEGYSGIPSK